MGARGPGSAEARASIGGRQPGGENGRVLNIDRDSFEVLVSEALDQLPPELTALMNNVAVFVEDDPPAEDPDLLGVYDGVPLPERDGWYAGVLPDRITIFRQPILGICDTPAEVVEQVEITVVHEIAHHFGIDDDRLDELGYG
jgi:predicted Zn-dependent protease with MMP-like domain